MRDHNAEMRELGRADPEDFDRGALRAVCSEDAYEDVPKQTRLEWQPFFQNPVARSPKELLAGLA